MDISVTKYSILTLATTAFNNFESFQIPFSAVKLNVWLRNISRKKIGTIVENNFRSGKDLIFKEDKNYFTLMKRTKIDAAEQAVNRLKSEIGHKTRNCKTQKDNKHNQASAYIFSYIRGTKRMHIKYLDLIPNLHSFDIKTRKITFGYSEYLKCCELPKTENLKINKMINLVI